MKLWVLQLHSGPSHKHNVGVILGISKSVLCDQNFRVIHSQNTQDHCGELSAMEANAHVGGE